MLNFKNYCKDFKNIENYEKAKADNFKGWDCHHRLETHNSDGEKRLVDITRKELIALGMYYHRPANELVFLSAKDHKILHNRGKTRSEETRKKMSKANAGRQHSEEAKKKISIAQKGNQNAKGNQSTKGMTWYNNGKIHTRAKECPPGFVPGMLSRK